MMSMKTVFVAMTTLGLVCSCKSRSNSSATKDNNTITPDAPTNADLVFKPEFCGRNVKDPTSSETINLDNIEMCYGIVLGWPVLQVRKKDLQKAHYYVVKDSDKREGNKILFKVKELDNSEIWPVTFITGDSESPDPISAKGLNMNVPEFTNVFNK